MEEHLLVRHGGLHRSLPIKPGSRAGRGDFGQTALSDNDPDQIEPFGDVVS